MGCSKAASCFYASDVVECSLERRKLSWLRYIAYSRNTLLLGRAIDTDACHCSGEQEYMQSIITCKPYMISVECQTEETLDQLEEVLLQGSCVGVSDAVCCADRNTLWNFGQAKPLRSETDKCDGVSDAFCGAISENTPFGRSELPSDFDSLGDDFESLCNDFEEAGLADSLAQLLSDERNLENPGASCSSQQLPCFDALNLTSDGESEYEEGDILPANTVVITFRKYEKNSTCAKSCFGVVRSHEPVRRVYIVQLLPQGNCCSISEDYLELLGFAELRGLQKDSHLNGQDVQRQTSFSHFRQVALGG